MFRRVLIAPMQMAQAKSARPDDCARLHDVIREDERRATADGDVLVGCSG